MPSKQPGTGVSHSAETSVEVDAVAEWRSHCSLWTSSRGYKTAIRKAGVWAQGFTTITWEVWTWLRSGLAIGMHHCVYRGLVKGTRASE